MNHTCVSGLKIRLQTKVVRLLYVYQVHMQQRVRGVSDSTIAVLRGTIVGRTYGTGQNLRIYLLLRTIFGPSYYGPP